MAPPDDLQHYYTKLAQHEPITENEILDLLQRVKAAETGLAYLASCQAATLESLPKSTAKSARARHVSLCKMAAEFIDGNLRSIPSTIKPEQARQRCIEAVQRETEV